MQLAVLQKSDGTDDIKGVRNSRPPKIPSRATRA